MKYQRFTPIVLFVIMAFTACSSVDKDEEVKPNFLILISDDQRWDQISYADNPIIPELNTPNMDKLAEDGVYFRNAFITTPICAVSRASIMTGRYVSTHGMNHFNTPIKPDVLGKTYPAVLRENGYRTGLIGKWGMGIKGTEEIFDVFNGWYHQGPYFHDTDSGRVHNSKWLADRAREFFESGSSEQPFCLTICYKAPHHPYQPDERDKRLFEDVDIPKRETDTPEAYEVLASHVMDSSLNRWCYYDERGTEEIKTDWEKNFLRCVMSLDRSIGEVMQSLEDLELDKNTVTIFLSDHGYLWGEHNIGGKWLLYEESIRTPIIIKDPRVRKTMQGLKLNQMALNIDIAPTLMDLAGIPVPAVMDGLSLLPVLEDKKAPLRDDFFMEHVGIIEVKTPIPDSRGVRTEDWKYIRYINVEPEVEEMYYIRIDPFESRNLIDDPEYADVKSKLLEKYDNYLKDLQK